MLTPELRRWWKEWIWSLIEFSLSEVLPKLSLYRATSVLQKTSPHTTSVLLLAPESTRGSFCQSPFIRCGSGCRNPRWTLLGPCISKTEEEVRTTVCMSSLHILRTHLIITLQIIYKGYKSSVALVYSHKPVPTTNPWLIFWNTSSRLWQWDTMLCNNKKCVIVCYQRYLKNCHVLFSPLLLDQLSPPVKSLHPSMCPSGWATVKSSLLEDFAEFLNAGFWQSDWAIQFIHYPYKSSMFSSCVHQNLIILCPETDSKILKCTNLFESLQDIQRRIMVVTGKLFATPEKQVLQKA